MKLLKKAYKKAKCQKPKVSEHTQKLGKSLMKPIEWIEIKLPKFKFPKMKKWEEDKSKEEE
ncbi:MAG: hypothetical protein V3V78_02005 [Candidatus Woesearchaeota archaeon]